MTEIKVRDSTRFKEVSAAIATALVLFTAAGATAGASPAPARHARSGQVRSWGGTRIQSLGPADVWSPRLAYSADSLTTQGTRRPADQVLSDERTFTRWAYVARLGTIHQSPFPTSRRVAGLHWYTSDGFPEVYLLLRLHQDARGREWVKLRIPMRPNGRVGWVRRQDLGAFHLTHMAIIVDREQLRMYLLRDGHRIWSAPVGVGQLSMPTPAGHFWIREIFKIADRASGYWPYAFGTADYSTLTDWPGGGVVGIHGPYGDPAGIPGHISHGCIRLRTGDDAWLARRIGLGTPLDVR